jgi:hypothetical protein
MKTYFIMLLLIVLFILNKYSEKPQSEQMKNPKPKNSITSLNFNCIQKDVDNIDNFIDNKFENVCTYNGNDNDYNFIKTIGRPRTAIPKST